MAACMREQKMQPSLGRQKDNRSEAQIGVVIEFFFPMPTRISSCQSHASSPHCYCDTAGFKSMCICACVYRYVCMCVCHGDCVCAVFPSHTQHFWNSCTLGSHSTGLPEKASMFCVCLCVCLCTFLHFCAFLVQFY